MVVSVCRNTRKTARLLLPERGLRRRDRRKRSKLSSNGYALISNLIIVFYSSMGSAMKLKFVPFYSP